MIFLTFKHILDRSLNISNACFCRQESGFVSDSAPISTDNRRSVESAAVGKAWIHGPVDAVEYRVQHVGNYQGEEELINAVSLRLFVHLFECLFEKLRQRSRMKVCQKYKWIHEYFTTQLQPCNEV